jgi:hypothetical protein
MSNPVAGRSAFRESLTDEQYQAHLASLVGSLKHGLPRNDELFPLLGGHHAEVRPHIAQHTTSAPKLHSLEFATIDDEGDKDALLESSEQEDKREEHEKPSTAPSTSAGPSRRKGKTGKGNSKNGTEVATGKQLRRTKDSDWLFLATLPRTTRLAPATKESSIAVAAKSKVQDRPLTPVSSARPKPPVSEQALALAIGKAQNNDPAVGAALPLTIDTLRSLQSRDTDETEKQYHIACIATDFYNAGQSARELRKTLLAAMAADDRDRTCTLADWVHTSDEVKTQSAVLSALEDFLEVRYPALLSTIAGARAVSDRKGWKWGWASGSCQPADSAPGVGDTGKSVAQSRWCSGMRSPDAKSICPHQLAQLTNAVTWYQRQYE